MGKRYTISDSYMSYPYKDKDFTKGKYNQHGGAGSYVKLSDLSDHEYAVTYEEYKRIIEAYHEEVWKELFNANKVELPQIGSLALSKHKFYKATPHTQRKAAPFYDKTNWETDNYIIKTKWFPPTQKIQYRPIWKFRTARGSVRRRLVKFIKANPNIVNKLSQW